MKKQSQIFVILFTFACAGFLFSSWLPDRIATASAAILPSTVVSDAISPASDALSPELLDYIANERRVANSESDMPDIETLLAEFNSFEASAPKADELLQNRFSRFPEEYTRDDSAFVTPPELRGVVDFWVNIFGVYDKNQVVFYNADDVSVVYSVLDFSKLDGVDANAVEATQNQLIQNENARLQKVLARLAPMVNQGDDATLILSSTDRPILAALRQVADHVATNAPHLQASLAYRSGFAHRMRQALLNSAQYLPAMQEIFHNRGLPEELTVLPFVESAFNARAYSSAGAAGVWQFIEDTGRNYLRIDNFVDERYDPVLATYAAAEHLGREFKFFRSWPLTINAYNAGPGRILQAMRQLGTSDIATIVKNFKGSGYGFDSRNYVPEFLAVLEVYRQRELYFGAMPVTPAHDYEYIKLPASVNLLTLARLAGLNDDDFKNLNAAFKPVVLNGEVDVPAGYLVKVPLGKGTSVAAAAGLLGRAASNQEYGMANDAPHTPDRL